MRPWHGWHIDSNEGLDDEKACAHHVRYGGFRNGVVCSSLVGAMIDEGVPEEETNLYGEEIRRGGSWSPPACDLVCAFLPLLAAIQWVETFSLARRIT